MEDKIFECTGCYESYCIECNHNNTKCDECDKMICKNCSYDNKNINKCEHSGDYYHYCSKCSKYLQFCEICGLSFSCFPSCNYLI